MIDLRCFYFQEVSHPCCGENALPVKQVYAIIICNNKSVEQLSVLGCKASGVAIKFILFQMSFEKLSMFLSVKERLFVTLTMIRQCVRFDL